MSALPLDAPPAPAPRAGRLRALWKTVSARSDVRHASILTMAAIGSQVVALGTAPILARLFTPADFGALAVLMSVATIGGSIGALCYESAVLVPRSERAARALFALALRLGVLAGVAVGAVAVAILAAIPGGLPRQQGWLIAALICPAVMLTALYNVLGAAHSRASRYWSLARGKIAQGAAPALAQIALGLLGLGVFGLLVGRVAGMALAALVLVLRLPADYRIADVLRRPRAQIAAAGRAYRDFLFHVPRQLLVRGANGLAPVLLLANFGAAPAGLFFFAQRLVERPGALLGDALSRVPLRQFAKRRAERKPLLRIALAYTLCCAAPVVAGVVVLSLFARPLFAFLFGPQWIEAADYAVVMGVWAGFRLSSLPVATLITVLRVQKLSLVVDAVSAARVLVIPLIAAAGGAALAAVQAFVALSAAYHLVTFGVGLAAAWRYDRRGA